MNKMKSYNFTRNILYEAYKVGASEIAEKILDKLYDQAKYRPTTYVFTEKVYVHRYLPHELLTILKQELYGIKVEVTFTEEKNEEGLAVVTIDWSY
jgi:hypothetical protein